MSSIRLAPTEVAAVGEKLNRVTCACMCGCSVTFETEADRGLCPTCLMRDLLRHEECYLPAKAESR